MIELRFLALAGLIVTIVVSCLLVTGLAALTQRIRRARRHTFERGLAPTPLAASAAALSEADTGPLTAGLAETIQDGQTAWRLRC